MIFTNYTRLCPWLMIELVRYDVQWMKCAVLKYLHDSKSKTMQTYNIGDDGKLNFFVRKSVS